VAGDTTTRGRTEQQNETERGWEELLNWNRSKYLYKCRAFVNAYSFLNFWQRGCLDVGSMKAFDFDFDFERALTKV
jgi:hypothetical protein